MRSLTMHNLIEGFLAMGWFFTSFLFIYRSIKAHEPNQALCPAMNRYPGYKKSR
jgi:hypothetical protein